MWSGGDLKRLEVLTYQHKELCHEKFADLFTDPGDFQGINFLATEKGRAYSNVEALKIQYQLQDPADLVDGLELELKAPGNCDLFYDSLCS